MGLAALIVGSLLSSATVGTRLMYGGLFTFTEGMWGQWRDCRTDRFLHYCCSRCLLLSPSAIGDCQATSRRANHLHEQLHGSIRFFQATRKYNEWLVQSLERNLGYIDGTGATRCSGAPGKAGGVHR